MKLNILKLAIMSTLAVVAVDGYAQSTNEVSDYIGTIEVDRGSIDSSSQNAAQPPQTQDGRLCSAFASELSGLGLQYIAPATYGAKPKLTDSSNRYTFGSFTEAGQQRFSSLMTYKMNGRSYASRVMLTQQSHASILLTIGQCKFNATFASPKTGGAGQLPTPSNTTKFQTVS